MFRHRKATTSLMSTTEIPDEIPVTIRNDEFDKVRYVMKCHLLVRVSWKAQNGAEYERSLCGMKVQSFVLLLAFVLLHREAKGCTVLVNN